MGSNVFPVDGSYRSGVGIGQSPMLYIPALFSGKLLKKYYDSTILTEVTNTEYEGEIRKFGDTVYIRSAPTLTIRDYEIGMTVVNETPTATSKTLLIDQGKYWSFVTDDVEKAQTDIKSFVEQWSSDAAVQLRITLDSEILEYMASNPGAGNFGVAAGVKSGAYNLGTLESPVDIGPSGAVDIKDLLVDAECCLDEQNVPENGRFCVISPRISGFIQKSDLSDASFTGDSTSMVRTGVLGTIARFRLIVSNLLPNCDDISASGLASGAVILFGHKDATTFATQLTESKMLPNPTGFGTLHRGLQVFGREILKPEALGRICVKSA